MIEITITETNAAQRVDTALAQVTEFSRSMIQKLIYAQKITCNNEPVLKANAMTILGQTYSIIEPEPNIEHIEPEEGTLEILFEDDYIIVLNKQADLIVHPGAGHASGTLINHLAYYVQTKNETLSDYNGAQRLGIVHRLDKGVSGCIIIAKTNAAHVELSRQFQKREIHKEYIALSYGKFAQGVEQGYEYEGIFQDYIARCTHNRKKMMCKKNDVLMKEKDIAALNENDDEYPSTHGKYAIMDYKILECFYVDDKFGFISLVQCNPHTGRMHQIRVQLASRKLPIIGDTTYGSKQNKQLCDILGPRIALHARAISFTHPITKQPINVETQVPDTINAITQLLRK